jgi:hypothetical protein
LLFRAAYNRFFARFGQGVDFNCASWVSADGGVEEISAKEGVKPGDKMDVTGISLINWRR